MKTLAVPERGNLVVTGALPAIAATQGDSHKGAVDTSAGGSPKKAGNYNNTGGHPEAAKSWFNRMYLRVGETAAKGEDESEGVCGCA